MAPHVFSVYAIVASSDLKPTWELPDNVESLKAISLWGDSPSGARSRFTQRIRSWAARMQSWFTTSPDGPQPFSALHRQDDPFNVATFPRASSATRREVQHEVDAAFEALLWAVADPRGDTEFLAALRQLFDLSEGRPMVSTLRTRAALDSILRVLNAMQDEDPSDGTSPHRVTVADACVVLDLLERQLRPLFEPAPVVDLCHATSNGLAILPGLSANWTYGTPLIISEHGIYLRERYLSMDAFSYERPVRRMMLSFFKHLTRAGYQVATAVAPGSEYNCQWLEANGCDPARIRPIHNGVNAAEFIRSASEPAEPTLVWLGRIDPLKDVETLLHTFARVLREKPETKLRIFGTASKENQGYYKRCLDLADRLGLGESVRFEGHVDSVLDAYHAGHVFLLTSISEGFPYTLIEAMASGKATVATDVGGVREASAGAGIIVPPRDPERMASACLMFLNDASLRSLVGRAARERILSRFTLDRSLSIFGDLYREVTGSISSAPVLEEHHVSSDDQRLEQYVLQLVEQFLDPTIKAVEVRELARAMELAAAFDRKGQ